MEPLSNDRPDSWSHLWRAGNIFLLLLGFMLLAATCSGRLSLVFLLPSSAAFLIGIRRRSPGWLIPAGLLGGIALSILGEETGWLVAIPWLDKNGLRLIAQGIGWLSIAGFTRRFTDHPQHWPLLPGILLLLAGIFWLLSRLLVGIPPLLHPFPTCMLCYNSC